MHSVAKSIIAAEITKSVIIRNIGIKALAQLKKNKFTILVIQSIIQSFISSLSTTLLICEIILCLVTKFGVIRIDLGLVLSMTSLRIT